MGEIIAFSEVTNGVIAGQYILSKLLRGRRDTLDFMEEKVIGSAGVVISHLNGGSLNSLSYDEADLFVPQNYKVVSSGQEATDAIPQQDGGLSKRCTPFRPCNVRGHREGGTDDWIIEFCRTDRKLFRTFSEGQVPMSDNTEEYRIEILDPGASDALVQTLSMTATANGSVIELAQYDGGGNTTRLPQARLKRADQAAYAPWASAAPASIKVNIWQVGDIIVKGNERTETLTFPSHF